MSKVTRVGLRCDAAPASGVGHLVRCVALAEELCARGVEVVFLGEVRDSPFALAQLKERRYRRVTPPEEPARLAALAGELRLDAVVLDSYDLPQESGAALREAGLAVLAIVDGDPLGQEADLYVDQNLGAERLDRPGDWLAGADYVLLRDSVRGLARTPRRWPLPRVLCFFGGTDSAGVVPAWTRALRETGVAFEGTVVSPTPFATLGSIKIIEPTSRLPELMAGSDLVVTAAGSAIWELLHLGVPTALSWVADNQLIGYRELVGRGVAAALGPVPDEQAVGVLARLLADPAAREALGRRGRGLVDGKGRERVADALLALR
ncbi:PseG/SpsG family protein [Nonomuraea purpurea]|uniref:PseG/SpsG family protein n=1 Tax=Nonomuraea purpurea TaxID=1849276 RepID=A0ABV8GDC5_9ACTN